MLGLIAFCVAVGFGVLVPVLPVFARAFGVDNFAVGAVVSAFAAMRLLTSPFCGRLIDTFGERTVMATGIFVVALSSGVAGVSQSYGQLLVLRGVGGVGLVLLRTRSERLDTTAVPVVPFRQVLGDKRYQAACVTNLAQGWTSFGVRSTLIPVLVVEVLDRPPSWTGIAFACAAVAQTLAVGPVGRFVDTVGRRPAMVAGGTIAGLAILAVPFAPTIWLLVAALCLYGVAAAFLGTAPAASVGDAAGGRGGTAVAVFSMCSDVGAIVGPLVAGWLADTFSYPAAFAVGAVLLLGAAATSARMPRTVAGTAEVASADLR